jgi:DNA-binding response OmpR family regulator
MGRIFVVEDDPDVRHVVIYSLREANHEVVVHRDGESALEALLLDPPDLLILDIMMPGYDGFEILEQMRSWGVDAETRTIVLSARTTERDRRRALGLGADDYIFKPFDPERLAARAEELIADSQARRGAPR